MPRRRHHPPPSIGEAVQLAAGFVGLLAVVKMLEIVLAVPLIGFGIHPREPFGLVGVLFAPLLHGNLAHLFANAGPLFVLLVVLLLDPRYRPASTIATIWIGGGLGTWLIGRRFFAGEPTVHIGASSLIYGLVAYLITAGFRMRSWRALFISLVIGVLYGGIFYAALPSNGIVSWEAHLMGAVVGFWAATRQHR